MPASFRFCFAGGLASLGSLLPGSRGTVRQLSDGTMKGLRLPILHPLTLRFLCVGVLLFPAQLRSPHGGRGSSWCLDVVKPVSSMVRSLKEERIGYPKFPENPLMPLPCSQTPVGCPHQAVTVRPCGPRLSDDEGSNTVIISRLNHTALATAPYASCRHH